MDMVKKSDMKKNLIKTWRRCRSHFAIFGETKNKNLTRSKTWHSTTTSSSSQVVAPGGCFSVYVGPQKQRFVIKTEFANHPLFKTLLEDAESEYGFHSDGPILLPCDVHLFYKVLAEIDKAGDDIVSPAATCTPMILCSPMRPVNRGYRLLSPSRFINLNRM
ncbi:SAUR-like auxin-responsive protein family [Euphorbia peplus]|nr:SAUR-like auxin-responsive protein family [Euphorbia peplus]